MLVSVDFTELEANERKRYNRIKGDKIELLGGKIELFGKNRTIERDTTELIGG